MLLEAKTMINVDESNCSGCGACEQICPKKAITLIKNENGFSLPAVDNTKCIKCKVCLTTCPFRNQNNKKSVLGAYAGFSEAKESDLSSSGGMFYELARQHIASGGVVFGAAYDENFNVNIICIRNIYDLRRIQGSKYVQASTQDTYYQVKSLLHDDVKVLYSGTPCQIAGLYSYLKNEDLTHLITAEIICHGVMSPQFFKDYIKWIEDSKRKKLKDYRFRTKNSRGQKDYHCELTFDNGEISIVSGFHDPYYQIFMKSNSLRKSCYNCVFSSEDRMADITLGDFWNIEDLNYSTLKRSRISAITCNSEKGHAALDMISAQTNIQEVEFQIVKRGNSNLSHSTSMPNDYFEYSSIVGKNEFFQKIQSQNLMAKKENFNSLPLILKYSLKKIRRFL